MTTPTTAVLDATEITQAVQDLQHSVTLIAGKATVIRAYVSGTFGPAAAVSGALKLVRSPTDPGFTVLSANTVSVNPSVPQDLATRRGDITLSLNFLLPPALTTEGALSVRSLTLTDTVSGNPVRVSAPANGPTVWFHNSPPLRVKVFGLRYEGGDVPGTHTPRDLDYTALISWLKRAYPVAEVISSHTVIDVTADVPFTCNDTNAQLAAIRALDISAGGDPRTHYLGQAADGGFFMRGCSSGVPAAPDPATVASSPCGAADWGWDFDGAYSDWYGGHELGHTFGRRHPGFCGESPDDLLGYPFPNGQLADGAGTFAGLDVGDPSLGVPMTAMAGVVWHDVMTYCNRQWLSSYTYEGIRQRLLAEEAMVTDGAEVAEPAPAPQAPAAAGGHPAGEALSVTTRSSGGRPDERFPKLSVTAVAPAQAIRAMRREEGGPEPDTERLVSVVGTVNLTRRAGGIRFVNPVSAAVTQPAQATPGAGAAGAGPNGEAPVVLRVQQTDGAPARDFPVTVKLGSDPNPGEERTGLVDAVVPVGPSPASIELLIGGQVVDTFRPGGTPTPLLSARHAGAADGAFALTLDFGSQVPEPGQTFAAQVSTDDGITWQTIGVGLKDPAIKIDRGQFQPGQRVQLRIITTNGFTSSTSDVESFQV
ncbi:hypothetical protein [Streptomyces sp. NRRL F-2580]|uniref:hypothetical protein n=1 Tax=Streptomyces sp. NRRL F-2580 TaxID=1463841 RepID=UPI00068BB0A4|nr:hypothetical protein [Streptomyces sp. NRRL F-2580]